MGGTVEESVVCCCVWKHTSAATEVYTKCGCNTQTETLSLTANFMFQYEET